VHDIKGEDWTLTAGWRSRFGRVLLFDPTNPESSAYNPLLEVRRGDAEVRDVQNVADILVDPEGALERRNHWEKTSHSLLVGACMFSMRSRPGLCLAWGFSFPIPAAPSSRFSPPGDHAPFGRQAAPRPCGRCPRGSG